MIYLVLAFILLQLVCCQDVITTIAGTGTGSYSGDNGVAVSATLYLPYEAALDASGTITITALCCTVTQYVAHLVISLDCRKLILSHPYSQRVHRG